MTVQVHWFTEMGYAPMDEETLSKHQKDSYFTLPNKLFDPKKAHRLYNQYHEQYGLADKVGFDGIMTNEHHNAWWCMKPAVNIDAAVIAKVTSRCKIAILGNVIPVNDPVRMAEEIAMLDVISGGRIISGFVRGTPVESLQANVNPADNMERFQEAHDLIVKTWTTDGPFRWEGKHYHHRVVNPWMKPIQKPHPPIWYPGTSSVESVVWAAERGYTYICLGSLKDIAIQINDLYHKTAHEAGHKTTAEHYGYLVRAFVADTDEKAYEIGKGFMWNEKYRFAGPEEHMDPPGYRSRDSAKIASRRVQPGFGKWSYEQLVEMDNIIVGSPKTVIKKMKMLRDDLKAGHLLIYGQEGPMAHKDVMRSIELWGREVIPALKEG
ncbi:MAG: LLM class flavin-dependent oxidoreductase [SAR202 cluster bacterium]|nr:LLM class flavin-dependent oxidoreductase [SAR202 cluster bacterium]